MKIKFLLLYIISSLTFAQIGVNKTNVNVNSAFETGATNQGVLIPRIPIVKNLTDKTFLNLPSETIPDGLLIFCEGGTEGLGSGYYFWQNNQWNYVLDLKNIQNRLDITRLYSSTTDGNTPTVVSQFFSNSSNPTLTVELLPALPYKSNTNLSNTKWNPIQGTDLDFQVLQTNNTVSVTVNGNAQTGSNNYIAGGNDIQAYTLGFNIGVFIKKKGASDSTYELHTVGTFANGALLSCLVTPYTVTSVIKIDQVGDYTAKVFIMGRRNFVTKNTNSSRVDYYATRNNGASNYGNGGNYTYLTVGGKSSGSGTQGELNGTCNNTNALTMSTNLNILVSEITPKN